MPPLKLQGFTQYEGKMIEQEIAFLLPKEPKGEIDSLI